MPEVKKKLAVVGSRSFDDKMRLYDVLTKNRDRISMIISGGAKGADSLAVEWASDYGVPYLVFPALWRDPDTGNYNKGAGFKRNVQIVDAADVVMAFWDGVSTGTKHTIDMAEQRKKPVKIIKFEAETPLQAWFRSKDGLCCSSPICEHQEWPEKIRLELETLVLGIAPDSKLSDSELEKRCGVPIVKIRPVLEVVAEALHKQEMDTEANLGASCGCSGMPPCCSGHMEDSVIRQAYQEPVAPNTVSYDLSEDTL